MEQELQGGKIEVIFGPMFSGKSTELLRRIRRHTIANRTCLVIKYKNDTRYADQEMATHDRQLWTATPTEKLSEIIDLAKTVEVIGIDEGQFFPDLIEFCENMANEGRTVIVAALDGTFQRKPFADVLSLIPLCENITKLNAVCMICYKDAAFTKRLGKETKVEVIGGADMYISVCRTCFHKCDATNIPSSQDNEVPQIASSTNITPTSPTCKLQSHVVSHIQKKRILSVSMD